MSIHHGGSDLKSPSTSGASSPSRSMSQTPGEDSKGIHFTPRRARASFENLVAMANHQERLREARKMVWRDKGQPVANIETLKVCLEHALTGGLRSATLAFNIRACFNLVLALLRIRRVPRDHRFALIRHAVFGSDTWRFAAMLGTFTSIYKFLLNALPILIPSMNLGQSAIDEDLQEDSTIEVPLQKRKARLSLSAHAQLRLALIRKRTRRWHAALAGGIAGGLAIVWEKRSRQGVIGQQMFVRGLQGSYNAYTTRHNIRVPNGDVLVYSLACGQIIYAFILRPDTLPRSYNTWLGQASQVPPEGVRMTHDLVRTGAFDLADLDKLTQRDDITPFNKSDLLSLRSQFINRVPGVSDSRYFPQCFGVFKWMLPIYGALHFVPAVLFKRKAFAENPGKVFVKAGLGSIRSSVFLGVFVAFYETINCYKHKLHKLLTMLRTGAIPSNILTTPLKALPQWLIDILVSKASFWLPGFVSGVALFIEEKRRRGELAMYVLPKGLESIWVMARGKGWVFKTGRWGEVLLTSLGMAMVMSTYQNDPQHLSGIVRRIMYQFIGPN